MWSSSGFDAILGKAFFLVVLATAAVWSMGVLCGLWFATFR